MRKMDFVIGEPFRNRHLSRHPRQKPLPEVLRVNLMTSRGERFHVDILDFFQAKARAAFLRQAGIELGRIGWPAEAEPGQAVAQAEGIAG